MKEVIADIDRWLTNETAVALATVIQTWGSAPRRTGAKMAITPDGQISGSVSGGCVEGAVFDAGIQALESGQPALLQYGVADETAWDVGLACGGTINLFVSALEPQVYQLIRQLITADEAGAAITVIQGPPALLGRTMGISRSGEQVGTLGNVALDAQAIAMEARAMHSDRVRIDEEVELFIDVVRPAPTLVMVGGVHIAVALTSMAKTLGYRTVVIDPRRTFGSAARFPHVDTLIGAWPNKAFEQMALTPETAVALLTHDPKIDDPALKTILRQPVFYIGALGSRKTHAKRIARLRGYGFTEAEIGRIHGPIGLNLGASTPEEIALSVLAEIVKTRAGARTSA